jgi:hypothetical protein
LYAIDSSCDCPAKLGNIAQGVADACSYPKKPACARLLQGFTFGGENLKDCLGRRCQGNLPIKCIKKDDPSWCASYDATFGGAIYLFSGNSGCPNQNGRGFGPSIFHESIHSCNLMQEPYNQQPFSNVFNTIMKVCANWDEQK